MIQCNVDQCMYERQLTIGGTLQYPKTKNYRLRYATHRRRRHLTGSAARRPRLICSAARCRLDCRLSPIPQPRADASGWRVDWLETPNFTVQCELSCGVVGMMTFLSSCQHFDFDYCTLQSTILWRCQINAI